MTRAKDISKIVTDADLSGTLDVTGDLSVDNATLKVDSTNNRVGISTSSMTSKFEVAVSDNTAVQEAITIKGTQSGAYGGYLGWKDNWSGDSYTGYRGAIIADVPSANSGRLRFFTANSSTLSEKMRIDSTGRVMIGNTTEGVAGADELTVGDTSAGNGITIRSASNSSGALFFSDGTSGSAEYDGGFEYNHPSQFMRISTAGSEQMRIDASGNVGIGTSTIDSLLHLSKSDATAYSSTATDSQVGVGPTIYLENPVNSNTSVGGQIVFGMRSTEAQARIGATGGTSPQLVFGTNDAEAMRIDSSGTVLIGKTSSDGSASAGFEFEPPGYLSIAADGAPSVTINRNTNDGSLVAFRQANSTEGTISISGTTTSYNGGHISRWSRLLDNSKDETIVKGTVMTNLNEMVEWGDEDNEQLNKMAVSSVEGDANVAGVFVNWDNDDDWNDMNVAMTGDMVIRIAQGTAVARGDLLMSAGDGTAKPQDDDIVRSKTIAKVTSTNVSHTYDDGTYLVPCVLMAC